MLYFLGQLGEAFAAFNVFRYITFRTAGAVITALFFVFMFGPGMIALLRLKQGRGQPIREDGPQTHLLTKKGTPTMGGLMILSGAVISTLLWSNLGNGYVWVVLFVTIGFGAIGFYDDYLKVKRMSHAGFGSKQRLLLEALIGCMAAYAISQLAAGSYGTSLLFPFVKDLAVNLGYFYILFGGFVVVAAGNSVNLTDGLDGLAIVPVMVAAACFGLIAYLVGSPNYAEYLLLNSVPGTAELSVVCGALIGAGLGFLWFNAGADLHGRYRLARFGRRARLHRRGHQARDRAGYHRRPLRPRNGVGHRPGHELPPHRQARLPHGADPPPFRASGLDGKPGGDPLLDHQLRAGADWAEFAEAALG